MKLNLMIYPVVFDKVTKMCYSTNMLNKMFKITSVLVTLTVLLAVSTGPALADHETVICPQPYGGGVVCGTKTHEPVKTGAAENIGIAGIAALGVAAYLRKLSNQAKELA